MLRHSKVRCSKVRHSKVRRSMRPSPAGRARLRAGRWVPARRASRWWNSPSKGSSRGRRLRSQTHAPKERGIALVMSIIVIALLTVVLADMHESTSTSYTIALNRRDDIRAEYMAKSGLNLTRLLVAAEPSIRQVVAPIYQSLIGRPPPMLPVWALADTLLKPFCDYEAAQGLDTGIDLGNADGLGETDSMCEIVSFAENAKINVNSPLFFSGDDARTSISMQFFAMMGGYQSPSPYDPLFQQLDRDGQHTSRMDVVTSLIDWWDYDNDRTLFDPGRGEVSSSGSEDDSYSRLDDPYRIKNAPFDSLEEVRLVRGIGDDFWATFVEPTRGDPTSRIITIYGSGAVNVNEAPPIVLHARLCSFIEDQTLCTDPLQAAQFVQLLTTVRSLIPIPFFTRTADFLTFVQGRGGPRDLYPMLQGYLGPQSPLLFTPVTIPPAIARDVDRSFVSAARILTIDVTGRAGCRSRDETGFCESWRAERRINSVVNFHNLWTPPPPNAGGMPGLGIYHYYRIE